MIARPNYHLTRAYLRHVADRQTSPATVDRYRKALRHALEWADAVEFPAARKLDPFPAFLVTRGLAPASVRKTLTITRQFFTWCRMEHPHRFKPISEAWIESLQPPRAYQPAAHLPSRSYYTLEDVVNLCTAPVTSLRLQRAQAGAALLYLSGMRASALASIPARAVDLPARTLHQLPELGVRTKNLKAAVTYLLPIPALLEVVNQWDARVQAMQAPAALWYASIDPRTETLTPNPASHDGRNALIRRDLLLLCEALGAPYLSPHKLRHGHVVYGVSRASTMRELKAISLNVMHTSVVTTDAIYSRLVGEEVRSVIGGLK